MKLSQIIEKLKLKVENDAGNGDEDVGICYVSDLLSNVMGQAKESTLWVTMQGHQNIIAVASLLSLSAIIVAGGATIEQEALQKAKENEITILSTDMTTFDVAGKLFEFGLSGHAK